MLFVLCDAYPLITAALRKRGPAAPQSVADGDKALKRYRLCAVMQELAVSGSPSALLLFAISRPQAHTIASLHGTRSAINRYYAFDMLWLLLQLVARYNVITCTPPLLSKTFFPYEELYSLRCVLLVWLLSGVVTRLARAASGFFICDLPPILGYTLIAQKKHDVLSDKFFIDPLTSCRIGAIMA